MKINQPVAHSNQQVKPNKKSDASDSTTKEVAPRENLKEVALGRHQQLYIGAKSLMASLNKELKLDGSFSFSHKSSVNITTETDSSSILDKIDIEPMSFDFEAVAKNVLDFVSGVINQAKEGGASEEKLEAMFAQAREGVDMGFEQARAELGDMNMLNDDVVTGMDKSYELIHGGIDELHQSLFNPKAEMNLVSQDLSMSEQERGNIEIKTVDGDSINISFGQSMAMSQSQSQSNNGLSTTLNFSQERSFSFEVNGDLDEAELQSVSALVSDISRLADSFFGGDIEKAWQQANQLDFDQSQIAQYAFDFQEVKQVAITQNYTSNNESPIATLSPYVKGLEQVMDQGQELFDKDNLKDFMREIAQQQIDLIDDLVGQSSEAFVDFNQQILDAREQSV